MHFKHISKTCSWTLRESKLCKLIGFRSQPSVLIFVLEIVICYCLVTKSRLTLRNPMNCSPPGSSVHGILKAPGKNTGVGCHTLQGNLPNPGIEPRSPALAGGLFIFWATREAQKVLPWAQPFNSYHSVGGKQKAEHLYLSSANYRLCLPVLLASWCDEAQGLDETGRAHGPIASVP